MRRYSITRDGKEFTVQVHTSGSADVYWQPVNPKTGKGWQASRDLQHFTGERALPRAMGAWMRLSGLVKGGRS